MVYFFLRKINAASSSVYARFMRLDLDYLEILKVKLNKNNGYGVLEGEESEFDHIFLNFLLI